MNVFNMCVCMSVNVHKNLKKNKKKLGSKKEKKTDKKYFQVEASFLQIVIAVLLYLYLKEASCTTTPKSALPK